jgi:AcrR family transcriptional regulator
MVKGAKGRKNVVMAKAKHRFMTIGYGKTTMEEIADDCQISPAHLYNFYRSKLDLAVAVAEHTQLELAEGLRGVLVGEDHPEDVLIAYFKLELAENYRLQRDFPGMTGLLDLIRRKRKIAVEGIRIRLLKDLSLFLDEAMQAGHLKMQDPFRLAETLHNLTFPFRTLSFPLEKSLPDLEEDLGDVMKIVFTGIKKEPPAGKAGGLGLS